MDLALAFQKMQTEMGMDVKAIADAVGKSDAFVSQRVRLLKLDPKVQEALRTNDIDFGGARALGALPKTEQVSALEEAITEESEARKKRAESKPTPTTLPGFQALDAESEAVDAPAGQADGASAEAAPADGKKAKEPKEAKPKKNKKGKPEAKATAKTTRRVVKRRQRAKAGAQTTTKPIEERLEERTKEWVDAYIDEKTKGQGLEDGLSATKVKNLLKGFVGFLHEKKSLIVR